MSIITQEEEQDAQSYTPQFRPDPEEDSGVIEVSPEPELVSDLEMRNLMVQYSPMFGKDIAAMEAAFENFVIFHDAPEALLEVEALEFLRKKDLAWLQEKNVIRLFQFLKHSPDKSKITVHNVAVRPVQRKGELVMRVKRACIRSSAYALMAHLAYREDQLMRMEKNGELGMWLRKRLLDTHAEQQMTTLKEGDIHELANWFKLLSFDYFLESEVQINNELKNGILTLLRRKPDTTGSLESGVAIPAETLSLVQGRTGRAFLIQLSRGFHVAAPSVQSLCEFTEKSYREFKTETEWLLSLYTEAAKGILQIGMGEDPHRFLYVDALELHRMISVHPSFSNPELWPRGPEYLLELYSLQHIVKDFSKVRREIIIETLVAWIIKRLDMRFDPFLFDPKVLIQTLPDNVRDLFPDSNALSSVLSDRLKANQEIICFQDRRDSTGQTGLYLLYKMNLPGAFIRNRDRRSFYHLLGKENGIPQGIYGFLREVQKTDPDVVGDDQIRLTQAIREWEAQLEKERIKKEKQSRGFFRRILDWILDLFGGSSLKRRSSDESQAAKPAQKSNRSRANLPNRVEKVIDYVRRNNKGFIWLDEVMRFLNTTNYTDDQISEMLRLDLKNRFIEVESLLNIRRVFLAVQDLESPEWREGAVQRLESRFSPGPEIRTLLDYVRNYVPDQK